MKVLQIAELLCLTRAELIELRQTLEIQLRELPPHSSEYRDSFETLRNVHLTLERIERKPPGSRLEPSP